MVRALALHQCGLDSIPSSMPYVSRVCWFSTLLQEVSSQGSPIFPSHQKPKFVLICCDSFVVSSNSKGSMLG